TRSYGDWSSDVCSSDLGSHVHGWRGRVSEFNTTDALALEPGPRRKDDVATSFADLSAIRELDHSVGCCLRNTNGTADVGHCKSPDRKSVVEVKRLRNDR